MGCCGVERDRMRILTLALVFQGIMDVLIEFYEGESPPELKSRIKDGLDFIIQVGQDFEPSFKKLAKKARYEPYAHFDIFCRIVEGSIYQNRLAELRKRFLSVTDEKVRLKTRKRNAEFCMKFLDKAISTCLYEHHHYVPHIPSGIIKLCKA